MSHPFFNYLYNSLLVLLGWCEEKFNSIPSIGKSFVGFGFGL